MTSRQECKRCGSTNLDATLRDELGPLVQCRDCGTIDTKEESNDGEA